MSDTAAARAAALEQLPLRVAGPRPGFARGTLASVKDILAHHELMGYLVRRELKSRYKDSALGFLWSLMRPLTQLLIYYVAMGKFMGAAKGTPDFAVFIYTGLTIWTLFSEIVLGGTGSIVANSGLVKKVYLPREVFPISVVGSALFNFGIQLLILLGTTVAIGKFPTGGRWVYAVLSLSIVVIWGTALAMLLSAVNVYLRDVQYLVDVALLVMFWASPIVYAWSYVAQFANGGVLGDIYLANPMTLAVLGFQQTFWVGGDGQPVPAHLATRMGIAILIGIVLFWVCQRIFARLQANFAQEL